MSHVPTTLKESWPESLSQVQVTTESVHDMPIQMERVLLLDPESPTPLTSDDAKDFDYLLFGGILGDDPPKDRTQELRKMGFATRHLGPVQMTTDTAVLVSQLVLEKGQSLETIPYIDRPEVKLRKGESVELPFRYIRLADGTPQLPRGLIEHLKFLNDEPLI